MNRTILLIIISGLLLISCGSTKRISYFQDMVVGDSISMSCKQWITIKPKDMISIVVSSKDPELAALFNLPRIQQMVGQSNLQLANQNGQILGYVVDCDGCIDFPVLGKLYVEGMSREKVAAMIKNKLIDDHLVKDPIVTIDFMNLCFSLLGEVSRPGLFRIDKDQITLLEAISMAGDLTIYGKRDRVLVTREEGDKRVTYKVDLRSINMFSSPVFYLQQNDVVYVEPNNVRANQSTINGNTIKSVSLWMSIGSFLTTLSVLIFK